MQQILHGFRQDRPGFPIKSKGGHRRLHIGTKLVSYDPTTFKGPIEVAMRPYLGDTGDCTGLLGWCVQRPSYDHSKGIRPFQDASNRYKGTDRPSVESRRQIAGDVGYIGYFSQGTMCDLSGLVNGRAQAQRSDSERIERCANTHPDFLFSIKVRSSRWSESWTFSPGMCATTLMISSMFEVPTDTFSFCRTPLLPACAGQSQIPMRLLFQQSSNAIRDPAAAAIHWKEHE